MSVEFAKQTSSAFVWRQIDSAIANNFQDFQDIFYKLLELYYY